MGFDAKTLLLELVHCETESEVSATINRYPVLNNKRNWRPYGDNRNNYSTIGNQQANPINALVELLINGVDAMLIRGCHEYGISPTSPLAPRNMEEAAERFFGVTNGRLEQLSEGVRSALADNIRVIATGEKSPGYPCLTVIDLGEGQSPSAFPKTFLSLDSQNKIKIHFVQGTFNVGSTGVLQFCGLTHKYKLIVSRRFPSLRECVDDNPWGFTLIRRAAPVQGEKLSYYEYFAPGGEVPEIEDERLPLLPSGSSTAYGAPMEWGTFIKLYEYRMPQRTIITFDLWYELNSRLQNLALPIKLHECRSFKSNTPEIVLSGMQSRLASDRASIEDDFPMTFMLRVPQIGMLDVKLTLFKQFDNSSGRRHWLRNDCVFFTVNGQTHAALDRRFLERRSVGLDYLSRELMVTVDCSSIETTVRDDLFMASRDRLREGDRKRLLEKLLADELKKHQALRAWNYRRRDTSIRERVDDDGSVIELFNSLVKVDPTIAELLGVGKQLRRVIDPPSPRIEFHGSRFPQKLELKKGKSGRYTKECPINSSLCYVDCETDAANDYLSRLDSPGQFIEPTKAFKSHHGPWNGNLRVHLYPPENARIGDEFPIEFGFMDDSRLEPLTVSIVLRICKPEKKRPSPPRPRPRLSLPNTFPVYRHEWDQHDMNEESAVVIKKLGNEEVDIFVNMDNRYLRQELSFQASKGKEEIVKKQFRVAMAIVGLALYKDLRESEVVAEQYGDYRKAASSIAKVILPILRALGNSPALLLKQAS